MCVKHRATAKSALLLPLLSLGLLLMKIFLFISGVCIHKHQAKDKAQVGAPRLTSWPAGGGQGCVMVSMVWLDSSTDISEP